ncbi:MAG: aminoacetone oxidase family FAD-binding enzyme, partial [Pygmaiobacter sp.]
MNSIVIGGGAAGLLAAGTAAQRGQTVTVLEHSTATCRKVLITGKGRCNLTNDCDAASVLKNVRSNPKFLFSCMNAFPPQSVKALFEELGVPLKTERGRRVFPASDRAADIADALAKYAQGCKIKFGEAVSIRTENGAVSGVVLSDGTVLPADCVLLATGGLSYPVTGSTGDGYRMAQELGHTIVPARASLVPLVEAGNTCHKMAGLSLRNVKLSVFKKDKLLFAEQGEMLFTHFGVSGPLVLSASAFVEDEDIAEYLLSIDLKPALSEEVLYDRITRDFEKYSNREARNSIGDLLPASMIPVIAARWGVPEEKRTNQITREEKVHLVALLKGFELRLAGKDIVEHAVITAGGISVKEVNPKTMESKLVRNLYFAGEVLDV